MTLRIHLPVYVFVTCCLYLFVRGSLQVPVTFAERLRIVITEGDRPAVVGGLQASQPTGMGVRQFGFGARLQAPLKVEFAGQTTEEKGRRKQPPSFDGVEQSGTQFIPRRAVCGQRRGLYDPRV